MSAEPPPVAWLLGRARADAAELPPGSRAVVDQNAAYLGRRLAALGLPADADADALAAYALGAVDAAWHARELDSPVAVVARDLVRSAAQLAAPLADPDELAALERALSAPQRGARPCPWPPRCC